MKSREAARNLGLNEHGSRYSYVAGEVNKDQPSRVLEVGPGKTGIGNFLPKQSDVYYSDILEEFGTDDGHHVRAAIEQLPFKSEAFPHVVCLDVIEHLPADQRPKAIQNLYDLIETGGKLFISSPVGSNAQDADQWLSRTRQSQGLEPHDWVREHIQYGIPESDDFAEWFSTLDPKPTIEEINDLSVATWQSYHEAFSLNGSRIRRGIALARFAIQQGWNTGGDRPIYRKIFKIEKPVAHEI